MTRKQLAEGIYDMYVKQGRHFYSTRERWAKGIVNSNGCEYCSKEYLQDWYDRLKAETE